MILESALYSLGLILCAVLLAALTLEVTLRACKLFADTFLYEHISRKDFIDEEYHPYLSAWEDWSKPMFKYHSIGFRLFNTDISIGDKVQNNSLGFRCPEFTPPSDDEFRIVLIGGSAAWGSGASSNEATIAGQLEKCFNADRALLGSKSRAVCYNLAQVNGFQTQDILSLAFFANKIRPDVIVSFTGWNELVANYPMSTDVLEKYGTFYVEELSGWEPALAANNRWLRLKTAMKDWGLQKSQAFTFLHSFLPKQPPKFSYSTDELKERIVLCSRLFVEHLITINSFANTLNATHFQFMQPNLYWKNAKSPEEEKVIELYDEARPVHGGKEIGDFIRNNDIYTNVLESIDGTTADVGHVSDFSKMFDNEAQKRFYTLVHMNDDGQREVAEQMYAEISTALKK